MNEFELIRELTRREPRKHGDLQIGIGDDCSIIRSEKKEILITCDAFIEGIHFKREWASWKTWGQKAAAAALSDIAAMGGLPKFAWVQLSLPKHFKKQETLLFYEGLRSIFGKWNVVIAGGNTTTSPKNFHCALTIWGENKKRTSLLRSNAKPGDKIYVSGPLGGSKWGLQQLKYGHKKEVDVFLNPIPQFSLSAWLTKNKKANACIDISDGLLQDLRHIAAASQVQCVLEANAIPLHSYLQKISNEKKRLAFALSSGEEYQLAFTSNNLSQSEIKKWNLFEIGFVRRGKTNVLVKQNSKFLSFPNLGFEYNIKESTK